MKAQITMTHKMKTAAVTANATFIAVSLKAENVISLFHAVAAGEKAISRGFGKIRCFYELFRT